jgi:hypothetical protein
MLPQVDAALAPQERADAATALDVRQQAEVERHNRGIEQAALIAARAKGVVPPKPVTDAQRKNLSFYRRGKEALDTLNTPLASGQSLEDTIASQGLMNQARLGYEGPGSNLLKSEEQQQYRAAQRAFTEARLRKESGAAVPTSEYDNDAKTYFVQVGDSPSVIKQKRIARQTVLEGIANEAGRAYDEWYGEAFDKSGAGGAGAPGGGGSAGGGGGGESDPRFSAPVEGAQKGIPGIPGGLAKFTNGKWIRVQ